jgi:hypothetical protein
LQVDDVDHKQQQICNKQKKMRKGVMVMAPQHNIEDSSDRGVNIFTSELLNDQDVKMWHIGKLLNDQDVPFRQDRMSSMLHLNRNKNRFRVYLHESMPLGNTF